MSDVSVAPPVEPLPSTDIINDIAVDDSKSESDHNSEGAAKSARESADAPPPLAKQESKVIEFSSTLDLEQEEIPDVPQLKQLPIMLPPPELNEAEFSESVSKLGDFSRVLAGAMTSIGKTIHYMEEAVKTTQNTVGNIADHVIVQNVALQALRNTSKLHAESILESQKVHNELDKKIRHKLAEAPKSARHSHLPPKPRSATKPLSGRSRPDIEKLMMPVDAPLDTDVSKKLHEAMNLLHSQKLEAVDANNLHENLHDENADDDLNHETLESMLEALSNRVNELEDCIRIQDAVNNSMSKEIEMNIVDSNAAVAGVNKRIDGLDSKLDDVLDEVRRANTMMKALDKHQKRMDTAIEVLNKSVISLHTRPRSGFLSRDSSTRAASAGSRPSSRPTSKKSSNSQKLEDDANIGQDDEDVTDTDVLAELYEVGQNEQPALDAELHDRLHALEQKQAELDSKCQEIGAISTDANLTVRRLALEMQDLNGQVENVLHDHESSSHRPSTAASTASNNQYAGAANDQLTLGKNLFKMKKSWAIICDDLQYGLDQLLISGISDVQNDSFYQTMLQFRKKLCDILPIWEHDIGTTLEVQSHEGKMLTVNYSDVLVKVHPTMYQIQVMADSIVTLEKECKVSKKNAAATAHSENIGEHASLNGNKPQNEHMGLHNAKKTSTLTFDDVICSDRSSQLGRRFADALGITTPLLDELIDKVHLVSRLDTLEKRMNDKVLKSTFNALEKDLKLKLNTKVEHEEFTYSMSKKASVTEMQQFRENLYKQIDVIRNTLSNSVIQGGSVAGMVAASVGKSDGNGSNIDEKTLHALALERAETLERFDLLYKQFNDLTLHCEKFVPRDEVEKALHAIVVQVKSLKINSVELPVMKEALKQKADASDVKALVSALEQSIGEIAGSSAGAIHQKCLLCDKTVSRVTPVESIPSVADRMGEMEERLNSPPTNQGSPAKRPLSPSTANQRKAAAKMKMNSDLTVLRCSVDLPPLRSEGKERAQTASGITNKTRAKYEERIRSSGGAGMSLSKSQSIIPVNNSTSKKIR